MSTQNKTTSILVAALLLAATTPLFAQEKGNRDTRWQEPPQRNWFWDWLLGEDNYTSNGYYTEDDLDRKINLATYWQFSIGDNPNWSSPDYKDHNWEKIYVPAKWENEGFNGYDGYAWYRVHFDGRELNKQEAHFLLPGFIDDVDETYLNGILIGKSGAFPPRFRTAYNSNRKYYIPNEIINFNGDNVIAIRVYDEILDGGIVNGRPGIYTQKNSENLLQSLYGPWKFIPTDNTGFSDPDYNDSDWETLMVPSHWDNQGYRTFDGIAWYRKTFMLDFEPQSGKNYYLVLGKIDDFDMTYLNGRKIGETNDGRRLGDSQSYNKIRVYAIPRGLLNTKGKNVISVKVTDLGKDGGIYKGPVGIVEEADVTKIIRRDY